MRLKFLVSLGVLSFLCTSKSQEIDLNLKKEQWKED